MSMISSQCDELREKAKLLRGHVDGLSAPYVIPSTKELMALTMLDSADRMEQAADTILELRCKLAGVVDQSDEIERLKAENTELRRLVRTYRACHDHVDACRGCSELPDCEALEKMRSIGREVGIEVDENE